MSEMESAEASSSSEAAVSDLMTIVQSAAQITDGSQRDAALLAALRICRRELEAAEAESTATQLCLSEAKDTFDFAARLLSGGSPSSLSLQGNVGISTVGVSSTKNGKREGEGRLSSDIDQYWKRSKTTTSSSSLEAESQTACSFPIPTNPIHMPAIHSSVETGDALMSAQVVANHRELFYQRLLGISAPEVENYTPNLTQANLRNKYQLDEGIHIVRHWDTGADGLDAAAFRSKHKTWYTKMKPVTQNLGRRTGIHLRTLEPQQGQDGEGKSVLCRYNKDGTKSTVYLDISQLYDALFEIHCLEHGHLRGKEAAKSRVDELYANVPDAQVKIFVDTCPVCMERRGSQEEFVKVQFV